jgi:hypothetical protein
MGDVVQWKWMGVEFLVEKFEVPTHIGLGRLTPQGGPPGRASAGQGGLAKPLDTLDNPVIPRGLGWLRICMDDRYAWAGQGGEGVWGCVQGETAALPKSHLAPET